MTKRSQYSGVAKVLHWGFVIFFVYGVLKAVEDVEQLQDISYLRFEVLFALAFLGLLILRFFYMKSTQKTSLPDSTSKLQKYTAKMVHYGMYGTLGSIAITGLIIGGLVKFQLHDDSVVEILIVLHEFGISVMYWLIFIHISAAIYHRFLKDGVWSSMVPFWKEQ